MSYVLNPDQGRWDAETLMEAESIKGDPNRMRAAQAAAQEMAKRKEEEAKNMRKVGNGNLTSPNTKMKSSESDGKTVKQKAGEIYIGQVSAFEKFHKII